MAIVNGKKEYSLKSRGATNRADLQERSLALPPWMLCRWSQACWCFCEERKSTQIPQKELFWQGSGLPPTAASSSLLPSSIHLWGAAYSPSPAPRTHTHKPELPSHTEEEEEGGRLQGRLHSRDTYNWLNTSGSFFLFFLSGQPCYLSQLVEIHATCLSWEAHIRCKRLLLPTCCQVGRRRADSFTQSGFITDHFIYETSSSFIHNIRDSVK